MTEFIRQYGTQAQWLPRRAGSSCSRRRLSALNYHQRALKQKTHQVLGEEEVVTIAVAETVDLAFPDRSQGNV